MPTPNPNITALASLARTLVVLFAATFTGALVLPIAANGSIEFDWAHLRPVLATAAGAGVAAELLWVRTHLQAFAAVLGLGTQTATPSAGTVAAAAKPLTALALLSVFLALVLSGCTTAQATSVENAVFTVDQAACLVANEGFIGDSTAVQEFETTCQLAPSLENAVSQFINDLTGDPAAMKRIAAERQAAGK
jgi:hypothetical protein